MAKKPNEMIPKNENQPRILLWLEPTASAELIALLEHDQVLAARLVTYTPEQGVASRNLVVLDETTLALALNKTDWIRQSADPVVVLLDDLSVTVIRQLFDYHYLNIKGFFRRQQLAIDLVELGQLAQVLREESSLLLGEGSTNEHQPLGTVITAHPNDGQTALVSLFIDTKMRHFLHEFGQALDRAQATGIQQASAWYGTGGITWQSLFAEVGAHLRGEGIPAPIVPKSRKSSSTTTLGSSGLFATLSDASRTLLRNMEQKPIGLQGLHILIQGETGTGKTLIAHWIKQHLGVAQLQHLNVTALAANLVEAELFGSVRGGFTDAPDRVGTLLAAYGGIVFLDEIGDMPPVLQSKLLTYLDSYTFRPVGWPAELGDLIAPCFVVAATNRSLEEMVKRGEFREDLYHRFLYKLNLPPLRERQGDLPLLVDLVLQDERVNVAQRIQGVSHHTLRLLKSYPFRGNFRELENILSRACTVAAQDGQTLLLERHIYRAILEIDGRII